MNQRVNVKPDDPSLNQMDLDLRAYLQYMNYLTQHKVRKVKTVTLAQIPIDDEIHRVEFHIKDLKTRIKETKLRIDFQYHHHLN